MKMMMNAITITPTIIPMIAPVDSPSCTGVEEGTIVVLVATVIACSRKRKMAQGL